MIDRINIVGSGNGMELAPDNNCWGINSVIFYRDVDLHFDMHVKLAMTSDQKKRRNKIIAVAAEKGIPVMSCHAIKWTHYIRYPIEKVVSEFNTGYFSNGVCYMIAYAILQGVKELHFYGVNHTRVDMLGEYALQKPGVDYWLGVADGRGVKCEIHGPLSEIGKTIDGRAYGYGLTQEEMIKVYGKTFDRNGVGQVRNEIPNQVA